MAMSRLALLTLACAACAHSHASRYGEATVPPIPHPALEAALAGHDSALVTVWAQSEPAMPDDAPLSLVAFRGHLAGLHDGWLHLLRGGDTVRIGMENVRRIRMVVPAPRNRAIGGLAGAAGFALAGWAFTRGGGQGSGGAGTILGAAAVGGVVGFLLVPGSRYAGQIYPAPPPMSRGTP